MRSGLIARVTSRNAPPRIAAWRAQPGEERGRDRDADETGLDGLPDMHAAPDEMGLQFAPHGKFLAVDETDHDDDSDEAEGGDRRERGREGGIGDAGIGADHHVLRIAGDGRHAAAVRRGRGRDQIGQRIAAEGSRHGQHDRRHDEADRVVDQEGREHAGKKRHRGEQGERPVGVLDRQRAQRPEGAGDLEMRDDDHHAEQQRDRVGVDGVKGVLKRQRAESDHRRAAEQGNAGAVEAQPRNAAGRQARVGQDEDRERSRARGIHRRTLPDSAQIDKRSGIGEVPSPGTNRGFRARRASDGR